VPLRLGQEVQELLREAGALIRHKQAGKPVVEWRDGKTVWIGPEELDAIIKRMEAAEAREQGG